jgi:hypothetical protein
MKKRGRTHRNRNIYIYLAVAVAITVVALSAVEQIVRPSHPKAAAADYFEIRDAIPTEWEEGSSDSILWVTQVRFNITAVGGDAHRVVIVVPGFASTDKWFTVDVMVQNATLDITLEKSELSVRCPKNADGYYEYTTSLDCDEASGRITLLLKE